MEGVITKVAFRDPTTAHARSLPCANDMAYVHSRATTELRSDSKEDEKYVCIATSTNLFPFVQYTRRPVLGQQCSYFPGLA